MESGLLQPSSIARAARKRLLGIDPREVTFAVRGFPEHRPDTVARLERVGQSFVHGYHAALLSATLEDLTQTIRELEPIFQGFAFEGAGMALTLLDRLMPWRRNRLQRLLAGPGEPHTYMVLIGAGWALARLHARVEPLLRKLDPVLGWLVLDGYGFHEGYFHPEQSVQARQQPRHLRGYAKRAFDTGLGRSLWFVTGADATALVSQIEAFDTHRRADLWAGAGLACCYAGGASSETLSELVRSAGEHRPALAQGAAFAAKARERAGLPAPHSDLAVRLICGGDSQRAARVCDEQLAVATAGAGDGNPAHPASDSSATPIFEHWRSGIRDALARGFDSESVEPQANAGGAR